MIQYGEDRFKSGLQAMWKQCFPQDSDAFIAFYFDKIYTNDESLIYLEDGCPVAFLQMIPYPVKIGNEICSGGYLSGVMTAPDYRKRGYMEKLLNTAFDEMVNKGYAYSFLIPQEEWLFDFYGKYGYLSAFQERQSIFQEVTAPKESLILRNKKVHIYTSLSEIDIPNVYAVYDRFLMEKPNVILKTPKQFEAMLWV
ncbi:MAG: GNAT family N-acetyltransferase, partial [Candidatus Symbiothrix sp.]|nr:GNAT family N-acetyltransferase [Candidatus Symbiothrix sp.]